MPRHTGTGRRHNARATVLSVHVGNGLRRHDVPGHRLHRLHVSRRHRLSSPARRRSIDRLGEWICCRRLGFLRHIRRVRVRLDDDLSTYGLLGELLPRDHRIGPRRL
jgi:hypothetical protein